jgi:hypothetical protein
MKSISTLLTIILFPALLFSQWVQLGPGGGDIEVMERVDGDIWVGTRQGIYISEDEGETWQFDERFGRGIYLLLERVDEAIYIHGTYTPPGQSTGQLGLYRSLDEGASWTLISSTLNIGSTFLPDMVDILECGDKAYFRSSNEMYVATIGEWEWELDTINSLSLQPFSTVRQDQSTLVVSGATQISVSTDCGETWVDKSTRDVVATYVQYLKGDTLIGPQRSFGQWSISYDLGNSWVRQPSVGIYFQDKIIQLADGSYVEFGLGFFHAPQITGQWEGIADTEIYGFIEDAILLDNGEILVSGEEGLFRVNLNRTEMAVDFRGPPLHNIIRIISNDNGMYVTSSELTTYQSRNGGSRWGQMFLPRNSNSAANPQNIAGAGWIGDKLFMLANRIVVEYAPPYIRYDQIYPSPDSGPYYDLEVAGDRIFVAAEDGFWRGTESGDDFVSYPQDSVPSGSLRMYKSGDYIYLNRLGEWTRYLQEGATSIESLNWLDTEYRFIDDKIFRCQPEQWSVSDDDGNTWEDLDMANSGLPADFSDDWLAPKAIVSMNDSLFLTPSFRQGVFVSSDGGFTWEPRTYNIEGETILSIASDELRRGLVAAIAGKSLFGYFTDGFSNVNELGNLAMDVKAFPNPANSSIQLSFSGDLPRDARFSLISTTGQELVPYILNRNHNSALLVVEHLPEGHYYLAVQAGKEVVTTSIVVAR